MEIFYTSERSEWRAYLAEHFETASEIWFVLPIPLPYSTWSFDDDNFCPTVEEYASVGVDVSDWYAAQE